MRIEQAVVFSPDSFSGSPQTLIVQSFEVGLLRPMLYALEDLGHLRTIEMQKAARVSKGIAHVSYALQVFIGFGVDKSEGVGEFQFCGKGARRSAVPKEKVGLFII